MDVGALRHVIIVCGFELLLLLVAFTKFRKVTAFIVASMILKQLRAYN